MGQTPALRRLGLRRRVGPRARPEVAMRAAFSSPCMGLAKKARVAWYLLTTTLLRASKGTTNHAFREPVSSPSGKSMRPEVIVAPCSNPTKEHQGCPRDLAPDKGSISWNGTHNRLAAGRIFPVQKGLLGPEWNHATKNPLRRAPEGTALRPCASDVDVLDAVTATPSSSRTLNMRHVRHARALSDYCTPPPRLSVCRNLRPCSASQAPVDQRKRFCCLAAREAGQVYYCTMKSPTN